MGNPNFSHGLELRKGPKIAASITSERLVCSTYAPKMTKNAHLRAGSPTAKAKAMSVFRTHRFPTPKETEDREDGVGCTRAPATSTAFQWPLQLTESRPWSVKTGVHSQVEGRF